MISPQAVLKDEMAPVTTAAALAAIPATAAAPATPEAPTATIPAPHAVTPIAGMVAAAAATTGQRKHAPTAAAKIAPIPSNVNPVERFVYSSGFLFMASGLHLDSSNKT